MKLFMKSKYMLLLIMIVLGLSGCNSLVEVETLVTESQKTEDNSKPETTQPEMSQTETTQTETSSDGDNSFTDEDIEQAKLVLETYYNSTSFKDRIESIEFNLDNSIYDNYKNDNPDKILIGFDVTIKNNEAPMRYAILFKNAENSWEFLDEGY